MPPHSKSLSTTWQEFHGQCIESTCAAALTYLQSEGIVTIDDANFAELKKCKGKLQAEQFWSSALYDRAEVLRYQLSLLTAITQDGQSKEQDTMLSLEQKNTKQAPVNIRASQVMCFQDNTNGANTFTPPLSRTNTIGALLFIFNVLCTSTTFTASIC